MVEKADVRLEDSKGFFGIAPGKVIRLKYGPAIKITSVKETGSSFNVEAERISEEEVAKLPTIKGVLNWISKKDGLKCEFRIYENLFLVEKPELDATNLEARKKEINPNSFRSCPNALFNKSQVSTLKSETRFQFERIGFFVVDKDSDFTKSKLVFNRILQTQGNKK